jgi:trehalose/maltose transport system permease protein
LFYSFVGILLLYFLFPVYWLFISSLKNPITFFDVEYWPADASLINYRLVAADSTLRIALLNSLLISIAVLVLTLSIGALAGYALGRLRFRGRSALRATMLGLIAFPQAAFVAGLFTLISNPCSPVGASCPSLSIYNNRLSLVISYLLLTLPLTVWFIAIYQRDLPPELEEAAYIDGATGFQTMRYIMLPLAAPALVTTGILSFIATWNEYLFAATFTQEEITRTAPVSIARYGFVAEGTLLTLAASVVYMGPVLVLVLVFGPQIALGLSSLTGRVAGEERRREATRQRRGLLGPIDAASGALLLVLGIGVLLFVSYGWRVLAFPYPVDYGEGPLLAQTLQLARFENIYRASLAAPPYTVANYPPVYLATLVPFAWLFGPAFWYGRLLSWLSILVAALLLGSILWRLAHDRLAALIGGLMLLMIPYVSYWGPLYRVDSLALALSLAGLYVLVRWPVGRKGLAVAALLLVAAVYTRQSYGLAAPLAAFVWLLRQRPRRAFALAGLIAGGGLGLFLVLNVLTGGGFFFNIVTANVNEFKIDTLKDYMVELWQLLPLALFGTALFVLLAGWRRVGSWWLVAPYAVGAALSGLTIGKIGSNVNYLLELSAAICLALGALLAWLRPWPLLRSGIVVALAIQCVLLAPGSRYHLFAEFALSQPDVQSSLLDLIRRTDNPVLADENMGLAVLAGKPLYIQPFEITQLARAGVWNQQPFLDAIERQEFAAILIFKIPNFLLHRERWTPEMLAAIERRYTLAEQIGNTFIYVPR